MNSETGPGLDSGTTGPGLDKRKLADIVFSDAEARREWENFIHPQIEHYLDRWLEGVKSALVKPKPGFPSVICFDIPLFFETNWGQGRHIDEIWVVYAPRDICLERLRKHRAMDVADIQRRLAAQMSLDEKIKQADVVIDNSGSWEDTVKQLEGFRSRFGVID